MAFGVSTNKLLVVDDERIVRESTEARFRSAGFDVLTASDGLEAMEVYRRHRGEIVCLDLTMPKMSGDEVFRKLRGIDPDVRVVLTSGNLEEHLSERFAGQGLFGFVQKPEPLGGIIARLQATLAGQTPRDGRTEY